MNIDRHRHAFASYVIGLGLALFMAAPVLADRLWQPAEGKLITSQAADDYEPKVVAGNNGDVFIIWLSSITVDTQVNAKLIRGNGSEQMITVCSYASNKSNLAAFSDLQGGVIVMWSDDRTTGKDIYAQRLDSAGYIASGLWMSNQTTGLHIAGNTDTGNKSAVGVPSGDGGAIFVYVDDATRSLRVRKVSSTMGISAEVVRPNLQSASGQITAVPSNGGIIVFYSDYSGDNYELNAFRYDQNLTLSWAKTPLFTLDGDQGLEDLKAVADENGGAFVAWSDKRSGAVGGTSLRAARFNVNGDIYSADWGADGNILADATNSESLVKMEAFPGGFVAAWFDTRNGINSPMVYAQKMGTNGSAAWVANGVQVSTQIVEGPGPSLTVLPDRVYVAWQDSRLSVRPGVYVQHIDLTSGNTTFVVASGQDYVARDIPETKRLSPAITRFNYSGAQDAVIAWMDDRDAGAMKRDIYAMRISSAPLTAGAGKYWAAGSPASSSGGQWQDQYGAAASVPIGGDTILFTELSNQACTWDIGTTMSKIVFTADATLTLSSNLNVDTIEIQGGNVVLNLGAINEIRVNTVKLSGGSLTLQNGLLRLSGSWTHTGGIFNATASTIAVSGTLAQSLNFSNSVIDTLRIETMLPVSFTGTGVSTAAWLKVEGTGASLNFRSGSTFAINSGLTLFSSANGTPIQLQSSTSGSPFYLKVKSDAAATLMNVSARDCHATDKTLQPTGAGSADLGGNSNWTFEDLTNLPEMLRIRNNSGTSYQMISSGSPSGELFLETTNKFNAPVAAPADIAATLTAYSMSPNYESLTNGTDFWVSTDSTFPPQEAVFVQSGQPRSLPFRFKTNRVGRVRLETWVQDYPAVGQGRNAWYEFEVLPPGTNFTNVQMRTDSQATFSNATSVTITPNYDGIDEAAVIRATPPQGYGWEVIISSGVNFSTASWVRQFYMGTYNPNSTSGTGGDQVFWDGRNQNGRVVPAGPYYARLQLSGGGFAYGTTLNIVVDSIQITGRVLDAGTLNPISRARVNAWGTGGGGFTETDDNGNFILSGLRSGTFYTVQIERAGYSPLKRENVLAGQSLGDVELQPGVTFRILATRETGDEDPEMMGNLNIYTQDWSEQAWGNVHFHYSSATSDNGAYSQDVAFTTYTDVSVSANKVFNVELFLPGYGSIRKEGITSPASGIKEIIYASTNIVRRANVSGTVTLPMPAGSFGQNVNIEARKTSESQSSKWAGAWINQGNNSASYTLYGVEPGEWVITARPQGMKSKQLPLTMGSSDVTGKDFSGFTEGQKIFGTLTIVGDSTQMQNAQNGWVRLNLNAWSPASYQNGWTEIMLKTRNDVTSSTYSITGLENGVYNLNTWVPGFELDPPGEMRVSLSGENVERNIVLKALTGAIEITALLPTGDDPALVRYSIEKEQGWDFSSRSGSFTSNPMTTTGLGTGLYRITVSNNNPGRGLRRTIGVPVTNGATERVSLDFRDTTYAISGSISFDGNIVLPQPWSVTVSSAAGFKTFVGTAPIVQAYSFPLPENSWQSVTPYQAVQSVPVAGQTGATFTLTGLLPGMYLLRVQEDLNPPSCSECWPRPEALPELAATDKVVFIDNASVSDVQLSVSNGVEVSGTLRRPDGTSDSRTFNLTFRRADNLSIFTTQVITANASGEYRLSHIAEGDYSFELSEMEGPGMRAPKYVAQTKRISVGRNANVSQDIDLLLGGSIVGKLRDKDSGTLITYQNKTQFLPSRFEIGAEAKPWVPGGYVQAQWGDAGPAISSATGQFTIYRAIPGTTYDVYFRGMEEVGAQAIAKGQKAYTPVVKSGIRVSEGQIVDLGVIDLTAGSSISGVVTDTAGTPLSNIRVEAFPAVTDGGKNHQLRVEAFTDKEGKYSILGADREKRYYSVVAAPRFESGSIFGKLVGKKYGEEKILMVDLEDQSQRESVNFQLTEANAVLSGKVITEDGGPLEEVFNGRGEMRDRRAEVVLHRQGAPMDDDPLGEIEEATDSMGNFRIDSLAPGSYEIKALSLGYSMGSKNLIVAAGENNAGTITLRRGASLKGTITKPDGSGPSTSEMNMVVGVDDDFQEFVFGTVDANSDTNIISGYSITGFKTGVDYSLIAISDSDDIMELKTGIRFSTTTEDRTLNLVFRPASPTVFVTQSRTGNHVSVRFFSTHKLRNLTPSDSDLNQILTLTSGRGTISSSSINSSRDTINMVYDIPANESSFKVRLRFTSIVVDPDSLSGANFTFDKEFQIYGGVGRMRRVSIANATGGNAKMEGIPMGESFSSGSFDVDRSSRVEVILLSATSLNDLSGAAPAAAPAARAQGVMGAAQRLGPAAYPSASLFKAVNLAPAVSPFSDFYEVLLPAGISHTLKKDALLTLHYDATVADPSKINVYYFDPGNNVFLLEANKRVLDTKNKTITVAVNHASTFVVLQNNAPVVGANDYTGREIIVYNFPNPFNLKTKTVALSNAPSAPTQTISGTMIKYALPVGKTGTVKIEIYTMVGELVRTIVNDSPTGGAYYYLEWDGKNDGGKNVASGVYLARMTLNGGEEKFFKMAVIK